MVPTTGCTAVISEKDFESHNKHNHNTLCQLKQADQSGRRHTSFRTELLIVAGADTFVVRVGLRFSGLLFLRFLARCHNPKNSSSTMKRSDAPLSTIPVNLSAWGKKSCPPWSITSPVDVILLSISLLTLRNDFSPWRNGSKRSAQQKRCGRLLYAVGVALLTRGSPRHCEERSRLQPTTSVRLHLGFGLAGIRAGPILWAFTLVECRKLACHTCNKSTCPPLGQCHKQQSPPLLRRSENDTSSQGTVTH